MLECPSTDVVPEPVKELLKFAYARYIFLKEEQGHEVPPGEQEEEEEQGHEVPPALLGLANSPCGF